MERRAARRFVEQIIDELNIRKVTVRDLAAGTLLQMQLKPNPKKLGPKRVHLQMTRLNPDKQEAVLQLWKSLPIEVPNVDDLIVTVTHDDFFVSFKGQEGWAGVVDKDTQVAIDTRLTPELTLEGLAREVIRHVQDSRRKAELEVEDRIVLYLATSDVEMGQTIEKHKAFIGNETLVAEWSTVPLVGDDFRADVKVDGRPLRIELRKSL